MSLSPAEMQRRVRQLDNDVASIYELVHAIHLTQGRHTSRLEELGADMDDLGARVDGLGSRVDGLGSRMGGLEGKMDEVLDILRSR